MPSSAAAAVASAAGASTFTAASTRASQTSCPNQGSNPPPGFTGAIGSVMPPHRVQASCMARRNPLSLPSAMR